MRPVEPLESLSPPITPRTTAVPANAVDRGTAPACAVAPTGIETPPSLDVTERDCGLAVDSVRRRAGRHDAQAPAVSVGGDQWSGVAATDADDVDHVDVDRPGHAEVDLRRQPDSHGFVKRGPPWLTCTVGIVEVEIDLGHEHGQRRRPVRRSATRGRSRSRSDGGSPITLGRASPRVVSGRTMVIDPLGPTTGRNVRASHAARSGPVAAASARHARRPSGVSSPDRPPPATSPPRRRARRLTPVRRGC